MGDTFLLLGPEKGLKEDFINKTMESMPQCSVSKFYGFEDYENEMFATLGNSGLFEEKKLIILFNVEELKTKQKVDPIVEYIKNPSDDVTFLLESPELYINASIMSAVKSSNVLKFYELFESKKNEWLRNFFRRNGLGVSNGAVSAIIERVDNNISEFESVCTGLSLYIKGLNRTSLEEADVEEFLAHTKEETPFTLLGFIVKKDLKGALGCLDALLNLSESVGTEAVLASRIAIYFRRALSLKKLVTQGNSVDVAFSMKYFDSDRPIRMPKDKEVYKIALANYNLLGLNKALALIASYDVQIRETGTFLQRVILDKMVIELVGMR